MAPTTAQPLNAPPPPNAVPPSPPHRAGAYMIAFEEPADALEWSLMLQELMMEVGVRSCCR
jgi:hypothetical protein